jgi:hypothetical protein
VADAVGGGDVIIIRATQGERGTSLSGGLYGSPVTTATHLKLRTSICRCQTQPRCV